jgi:hypothetical protein
MRETARSLTEMADQQHPDTVTEALALLASQGYEVEFQFMGDRFTCDTAECAVSDVVVERLFRFEGPSDPGDEMVVFGLLDPATGTRGRFASGFGPAADPEVLDHLVGLTARFRLEIDGDGNQSYRPA